jgi:ribonuclease Z
MDHIGSLPYWFSQRFFQKIGTGTCVCHPKVAEPLKMMMQSWVDLELQRTPHQIIALEPDAEIQVKNNLFLRGIATSHTSPSLGYVLIERRSKLKDEFLGLPQDRLREIKMRGTEITRTVDIPLVAYTGDTEVGPFLYRDEFVEAKVVITECTFFEPDHRSRAKVGKHIHVHELSGLLQAWKADHVVVVHVSRRTSLGFARECLVAVEGGSASGRVHLLMDHRANRLRHEAMAAAEPSVPEPPVAAEPLPETTEG